MKRVRELEAWSKPGQLLPANYGKELAEEFWALGIPRDVYLGLNAIPDEIDVENLKLAINAGELTADDFLAFCRSNSLPADLTSADAACKFLEFSLGRCLAWVHLPEDDEPRLESLLIDLLGQRGHVLIGDKGPLTEVQKSALDF